MAKITGHITFNAIEEKRYSNIRRNYVKLTANLSPVNAMKYVEYLRSKSPEELLEDFDCVYSVPVPSAMEIVNSLVKYFSKTAPSIQALNKIILELNDFRDGCETRGIGENIPVLTNIIDDATININFLKEKATERHMKAIPDELGLPQGSDLANAVEAYAVAVNALLESNDETPDEEVIANATKMVEAEEAVSLLKDKVLPKPEVEEIDEDPNHSMMGKEALFKHFNVLEIRRGLEALSESSTEAQCHRDDMLSVYSSILNDRLYTKSSHDFLYDKLSDVKEVAEENKEEGLADLAKEAMDAILITRLAISKENGSDSVFLKGEIKNYIEEEVDSIAEMVKSSVDKLIDDVELEEIPDPEIAEQVDAYDKSRNTWIEDMSDPEMKGLKGMLEALTNIQTILEDSGRDSVGAKIARKKEELARKGVSAVKKLQRKGDHAAIASKKAAEHVDNLVSSTVQKVLDAPYAEKREEILKGGFRVKLTNTLKKAARTVVAFAINPILGIIVLLGQVARDAQVDSTTRKKIVDDMEDELKMIEEKIDDAKSDGNKQEKYKLMRMKNQYERELKRIANHREKLDHSSLPSSGGDKK